MAPENLPNKWDHESDVLIIGAGTAGLPAAIVVAEAGLKATILEERPKAGGSFNMVAGVMAFAGTDDQKEAGIEDSPELFYEDMVNVSGADPEIARAFVDNQLDAYRMLKDVGIKFPGFAPHPRHSILRTHGWVAGMGPKMVKALENRARERGVEILSRHRATRLIIGPQRARVLGLKVDVKGEIKDFKAKRAVIIATGGFGRSREMIAEYAPNMVDAVPKMPVSHRGDGLKMALDIGAATKDIAIAVAPAWPVCAETHSNALWAVYTGGILVNKDGKRFHNESIGEAFYGPLTGAGMKQPGGYWVVLNEEIKAAVGRDCKEHLDDIEKCKQYNGNTIEELAKNAGIDPKGLKEAIDKYNSDIESVGYDTAFGRKWAFQGLIPLAKIDNPPFCAVKCVTSMTSMKGGLRINGRSQVINQYEEIIPGLYAAGEVAGGLHTKTYMLGTMTSSAMTFGIIAGRNAVKEPAWE